ncbi:MAG: hypothetical protein E5V92_23755 [Mesorhizobium sp.]|nr:MAG: hypothetical protein EOS61_28445 [Mesorhizobium sp.]TJW81771.1 MAG: hypothetical protein E5V92_23755 [Mesorhizobium sp.]
MGGDWQLGRCAHSSTLKISENGSDGRSPPLWALVGEVSGRTVGALSRRRRIDSSEQYRNAG